MIISRRLYILLSFCLMTVAGYGQTMTASAPSTVEEGDQFRLTYHIDTQDVNSAPAVKIPAEFEVLMGPSTSRQSSFQIINGHTKSSSSITFTYILSPTKKGTYTIPAATIKVGGKSIKSASLTINVVAGQHGGQSHYGGGGNGSRQGAQPQIRPSGSAITSSDLFIKVSANKKQVHEQEPILLTYKVYTLVGLTSLAGKMPDLKGFHTQEIQLPQQKSFKVETINGRPYRTVTWSQYVMFPQMTGKLEIPSISFDGVVMQQNRNIDPFEAFFNGGSGYVEVKTKIKAPGITINVLPLPARPANFSGGVGHFNISAQMNKSEVKANDPITLRVIVNGSGNLKLIKQPEVKWPKDFDKYDAKVTDKTKLTTNGVEGNMVYDFMAVPRHQGKFEIPPIEFVYYDTQTGNYKTIRTQNFSVNVLKGSGVGRVDNYTGQEDVRQLAMDIRYIKTGKAKTIDKDNLFFGSTRYVVTLIILTIVFISLFVIFRKRALERANITKLRGKKANKVATRRLKLAAQLMAEGKSDRFYDEVMRALWGYVSDKLSMPAESLSRDNISSALADHSVDDDTIQMFIAALEECEYERFAPGDASGNMQKTYEAAMSAITKIENTMKKKRNGKSYGGSLSVVLMMLMLTMGVAEGTAVTKENADSAYARQQYQQAAKDYEEVISRNGESADLYYNLANAYYRMDNIPMAVLNYERALLLSPGDGDIRFNLDMARSKTIDKITPESEMFFVTWFKAAVNIMSADAWAVAAVVALAIAIVMLLIYLFAYRIWLRKLGFFSGIAALLLFITANIFAKIQHDQLTNRTGAIIMQSAVSVKSAPANSGTDLFILHEGTRVEIVDSQMKDWKQVKVADGKQGWVPARSITVI